jgi:hypothetical protein
VPTPKRTRPRTTPPLPTPRGWRVRDFCEREGIGKTTLWRWVAKGVVRVERLDRATGVRVRYVD